MHASKILFLLLTLNSALAGNNDYYKNILIGGRASTMGGAYIAVSDDASGSQYNPAGLSLAPSNQVSGSAKIFNRNNQTYRQAIGNKNWVRESDNFLPSFFGYLTKKGDYTHALSFVLQDANIENQDQVFQNITNVANPIDVYVYNFHNDDQTNLFGYSLARKIGEKFHAGITLNYHYRILRSDLQYVIEYADATDESFYSNSTVNETGIRPHLGLLYEHSDKLSLGLTYAKTSIFSSETKIQENIKTKGNSNNEVETLSFETKRETPHEFGLGLAYFYSPRLLVSFDLNYYLSTANADSSIFNWSLGAEYYLNPTWALRGGIYTNNTNNPEVSSKTSFPNDYVNFLGFTTGISYFQSGNSLTGGLIYSSGSGEAQIFSGSSATRTLEKSNIGIIFSAAYGF